MNGLYGGNSSDQSVSLYTGQDNEIFPLISLPVRGLGNIDVSLAYNGNVNHLAKMTNREYQTSWVGLGFSLGFESISTSHMGTTNEEDDKYYYHGSSGETVEIIS